MTLTLNQGPFPPPALPGFAGTTDLSATQAAQPVPRGRPVEGHAPSPLGLPVLRSISVYRHAVVNTPVARWALIARGTAYSNRFPCTQRRRPSPSLRKVGDHIGLFEACSTFTGYYGLSARRVAYSDPSVSKAPTVSFPPPPLR